MDIEKLILDFVENISNTNFSMVISVLQLIFVIFWIFVLGWVWVDAGERTTRTSSKFVSVLLVGILNIVGLLIYLIIRPKQTLQDLYWIDLERRYLKYETAELGDCPNCKSSLQPGFNLCPKCGYGIKQQCSSCQVWIDKNYNYCPFCGQTMGGIVVNEQALTQAAMQEEVTKSKQVAVSSVENEQTKYVQKGGVVRSVKKDFFAFAKSIGDAILAKKTKNLKNTKRQQNIKKSKNKKKKNK